MNSLFDIKGKIALVTGGANGMGRMIAEGLVDAGVKVYITSRKVDDCEQAAQAMSQRGQCIGLAIDLSTPEAAVELAEQIKARETKLDIIINNAGKTWGAPLESFPDKAWASVMAVNVQGPFTVVRELLPLLEASGAADGNDPARVMNIGSLAGKRVEGLDAFSYTASKAAIHHLSREMAAVLAGRNIAVNTIVPGYFPTKMTAHIRSDDEESSKFASRIPLGRMGSAEDIVGLCIFLSSRAGAYITGSEIVLDGGIAGCK
jgi:NAD(P)-dependent dehydrogenase (short-subunit alcohol dehydrogenase family)